MTKTGHGMSVEPTYIAYQEKTFPDFIAPVLFTLQRNNNPIKEAGRLSPTITNPLRALSPLSAVQSESDPQPQILQ